MTLRSHAIAVLIALGGIAAVPLTQAAEVRVSWALAVRRDGTSSLDPIVPGTTVRRGDRIGLYISSNAGFVYLLHVDSTGGATLRFPATPRDAGAPATLPETWIEVGEHRGAEFFHLLGSTERLAAVEALARQPGSRTGEDLKLEILRLRRAHSSLRAPAERPVLMGGRVRGRPDLRALAVDVVATRFYARTIQVDHQ